MCFQTEVIYVLGAGRKSASIVEDQLRRGGCVFCATRRGMNVLCLFIVTVESVY